MGETPEVADRMRVSDCDGSRGGRRVVKKAERGGVKSQSRSRDTVLDSSSWSSSGKLGNFKDR